MQTDTLVAPVTMEYVPAVQCTHDVALTTLDHVPVEHDVQLVDFELDHVPGRHEVHLVEEDAP